MRAQLLILILIAEQLASTFSCAICIVVVA
jgi:hypothetical protein